MSWFAIWLAVGFVVWFWAYWFGGRHEPTYGHGKHAIALVLMVLIWPLIVYLALKSQD